MVKSFIHTEDIDRIKSLMEAIDYDGNFEIEIDESSGIGRTVIVHVPYSVNSLRGTFSYIISNVENW
jgi:hypothetical protein